MHYGFPPMSASHQPGINPLKVNPCTSNNKDVEDENDDGDNDDEIYIFGKAD